MDYPVTIALTVPTNELRNSLRQLQHYRNVCIFGSRHWAAIPELVAEMKRVKTDERRVVRELKKRGEPLAVPTPRTETRRLQTGNRVTHPRYGKGEIVFLEFSIKLKAVICTVRYANGEKHSNFAGDLDIVGGDHDLG